MTPADRRILVRRVAILVAGLALLLAFSAFLLLRPHEAVTLRRTVTRFGALAPLVFIALQASRFFTFLPGNVLTPLGGFLFGPVLGAIYSFAGTLASCAGGYGAAHAFRRRFHRTPPASMLPGFLQGEARPTAVVFSARLVPLLHMNLVSYASGALRVPFWPYLLGSALGILPKILILNSVGAGAAGLLNL